MKKSKVTGERIAFAPVLLTDQHGKPHGNGVHVAMTDSTPDRNPAPDQAPGDGGVGNARRRISEHTEELLDEALEESFPASDPPSIVMPLKRKDER